MGDDLGIGFGLEIDSPVSGQVLFQFQVVFDDAVVDDGDPAAVGKMRMGVLVARRAMGRPAGMADADMDAVCLPASSSRPCLSQFVCQDFQAALFFADLDLTVLDDRRRRLNHSRGIPGGPGLPAESAGRFCAPTYPTIPHMRYSFFLLVQAPIPADDQIRSAVGHRCDLRRIGLSPSIMTRMIGSVPEARTRTRPRPASCFSILAISARMSASCQGLGFLVVGNPGAFQDLRQDAS